jgi:dipeptidyl aminopeptidase/acylaminoacyl peptidase
MLRKLIASALFCFVCSIAAPLAAQTFTLQQVMSAPFNSELQASPKGSSFLWIANREGRRNLWVADAQKQPFAAHPVTAYTADDGQDIDGIAWTSDGQSIVYVRGGDFEFPEKPPPNPALLPAGVEQAIWIVAADGGAPRKIAEGRAPAVSPDGKTLAFLANDQIWTIPLADPTAKPVQLFHARGTLGPPLWSPDGKSLAFTSDRDDHSFIGVYSLAQQTIQYMSPSTEEDSEPVWSPDSRSIAFIRVSPDVAHVPYTIRREAEPWSLIVADAATGEGHEIWHATKGPGSAFRELGSDRQLFWAAGNRIVFPWEADGWLHLYSVSANGGGAVLLTPGEFEVEHVALSPDRASVVFSSNQGDIDRRHVWQLSPDAASPGLHQLTNGDGIEVHPVVAADGTVAVLRSDARTPIRPAIVSPSGELQDLAPQLIPPDFPAATLVPPQQVVFPAVDGMKLHGQLFLPATLPGSGIQRHPAIVFFHGGSRRQMLLGWHYMQYYSNAYAMNQYLVSLGYIVLSVNYRSGIGYGLDFREALNYGPNGAGEFNDVRGAGLYLRSRPDVDPTRIGVWGGSYGGYLTALALARASDLFAAGVDMHGVHDWTLGLNYKLPAQSGAARLAFESSPMASVKTWKSPVLLIQGDDDRNVPFANTVQLAAALRSQGVDFEEHVFPDEVHDFLLYRDWFAAYTLSADFFNRHLKQTPPH